MTRPRLLDLYCGAGGAAMGYHRAGLDVTGVDHQPQPRYPFTFHEADALAYIADHERIRASFDAIHASPPCQFASRASRTAPPRTDGQPRTHANLIPATRQALAAIGLPYVIENVEEAKPHLIDPVTLCGSSMGLPDLQRHRLFELSWGMILVPGCAHGVNRGNRHPPNRTGRAGTTARVISVAGHGSTDHKVAVWRCAMGIDWMSRNELAQAIPPAYTEHIGQALLDHICLLE